MGVCMHTLAGSQELFWDSLSNPCGLFMTLSHPLPLVGRRKRSDCGKAVTVEPGPNSLLLGTHSLPSPKL